MARLRRQPRPMRDSRGLTSFFGGAYRKSRARDLSGSMVEDFDDWYVERRGAMGPSLAAWCGDPSVAAEALDEAFLRALERWDRVGTLDSPSGWVWVTATNLVRRRARRSRMEQALPRPAGNGGRSAG